MRKAIFLTAWNRMAYLQETLSYWETVRGQEEWDFIASIEPSDITQQVVEEFEEFFSKTHFNTAEVRVNEKVEGVLHHPWMCFEGLFGMGRYDFVVRAEDDLIVSDDILEFFSWAAEAYKGDDQVATVNAFSRETVGTINGVQKHQSFTPWLWGTWKNRWRDLIGPTWDHDYSTYNGAPGVQAGWDWNLDTRIFPKFGFVSVSPLCSRVNNIGVWGVHGTAENFEQASVFQPHYPTLNFVESD